MSEWMLSDVGENVGENERKILSVITHSLGKPIGIAIMLNYFSKWDGFKILFHYLCAIEKEQIAMIKIEHTRPSMNKLTNIYKIGGG